MWLFRNCSPFTLEAAKLTKNSLGSVLETSRRARFELRGIPPTPSLQVENMTRKSKAFQQNQVCLSVWLCLQGGQCCCNATPQRRPLFPCHERLQRCNMRLFLHSIAPWVSCLPSPIHGSLDRVMGRVPLAKRRDGRGRRRGGGTEGARRTDPTAFPQRFPIDTQHQPVG